MTSKTAYLWGPVSSFSGALAAWLVQKGWHVHMATKGAFHVALSPLDLRSTAQESLEKAFGSHDRFKAFQERLRFLDVGEVPRGTKYDALIFCGLPPNFDEPRVSRAPWAAEEYSKLVKKLRGVPTFIVSSLWGAVQPDGVVPEEIECDRRKPLSPFEGVAQAYEQRIVRSLGREEAPWYLIRLPMICGSSVDGRLLNFSGPLTLFERLSSVEAAQGKEKPKALALSYDPDSTTWMLPVDVATYLFWRLLEDEQRPRICNLVSTQATLNREWMQDLAKVLGLKKAAPIEGDPFGLPVFLKKALNDNVQVKSRGLFEVMGRYQQSPMLLDLPYLERVMSYGRSAQWGKPESKNGKAEAPPQLEFSDALANEYFEKFVPANLDGELFATACGAPIAVTIEDGSHPSWLIHNKENQLVVESAQNSSNGTASVHFYFSGPGMVKLIQKKESLERALVMRQARVEGKPLDILKACNLLKRFFRDHPYNSQAEISISAESARELSNTSSK